jgi:lipopolysaccharide transport system permease protein
LSVAQVLFLLEWVRREFRIRYTQTTLGAVWAFVQPLTLTLIFVVVFDKVAAVSTPVPYASFVLPAMLAWAMFSNGLVNGVGALSGSMYIASKVSYPRIVAPLAASLLPVVDLVVAGLVIPVLFVFQDTPTQLDAGYLAAGLLGFLLLSAGLGSLLGALAIFVRDLRNVLPLLLQVLLLGSAVAYPRDLLPEALQHNPLSVFVEAVRAGLLPVPGPSAAELLLDLAGAAAVLAIAFWYVARVQDRFVDVA